MIWFACKQCGKKHSRADDQAGTMVFCDCGRGNRVPWSSTAPADVLEAQPVEVPAPRPVPAPAPRQRPVPVPLERAPVPRRVEPAPPPPPPADLPVRRPDRLPRRIRAHLCFNHDEDASAGTCAACKLPFCGNCLVTLQDQTLCGPCKNFKVAGLGRAVRVMPLAVLALVVSLVAGPVMLILSLLGASLYLSEKDAFGVALLLCSLAQALPITGLVLAVVSLRRFETSPQLDGRGLAGGAACAAAVGLVWSLSVTLLIVCKHLQG